MVPIRNVDWDRLQREVLDATSVERQRFQDRNLDTIIQNGNTTSMALDALWMHLSNELALRYKARGGTPPEGEPVVRALARVAAHPAMTRQFKVVDDVLAPTTDLLPWLRAQFAQLDLGWDLRALKRDMLAQLTEVHGDREVDDRRMAWMKGWGPAMSAVIPLIITLAFEKLGRFQDAPVETAGLE
jgi:hypothetical protein